MTVSHWLTVVLLVYIVNRQQSVHDFGYINTTFPVLWDCESLGGLTGNTIWSVYKMSSFYFYCWNPFKVIPLACMLRTRKLHKFLVPSNVQYCVTQVRRCAAWLTDVEEKQAWIGNCK